jgi:hypothetical protein
VVFLFGFFSERIEDFILEPVFTFVGVSSLRIVIDLVTHPLIGPGRPILPKFSIPRQTDQIVFVVEIPIGTPKTIFDVRGGVAGAQGVVTQDVMGLPTIPVWFVRASKAQAVVLARLSIRAVASKPAFPFRGFGQVVGTGLGFVACHDV